MANSSNLKKLTGPPEDFHISHADNAFSSATTLLLYLAASLEIAKTDDPDFFNIASSVIAQEIMIILSYPSAKFYLFTERAGYTVSTQHQALYFVSTQ